MPNPSSPETIHRVIPAYSRADYSVLVVPPITDPEILRDTAEGVSLTGCIIQGVGNQFIDTQNQVTSPETVEAKVDEVVDYLATKGVKAVAEQRVFTWSKIQDFTKLAA